MTLCVCQEQVKAVEEAVARAIGRISPPQQQLAEAEGRRELKEEAAAAARGEMEGLRQAHEMLKREMGLKEQQLGGLRDAVGQLRAELGLLRSQHQEVSRAASLLPRGAEGGADAAYHISWCLLLLVVVIRVVWASWRAAPTRTTRPWPRRSSASSEGPPTGRGCVLQATGRPGGIWSVRSSSKGKMYVKAELCGCGGL